MRSAAFRAFVVVCVLSVAATWTYALSRDTPQPTPTKVTAIFFDGVTHGDYRQTCRVWRDGRKHQQECVQYLALIAASSGPSDYRVLPHSYKGWREGTTEVASVRVYNAGSDGVLTARLVKTRHGWLVQQVTS